MHSRISNLFWTAVGLAAFFFLIRWVGWEETLRTLRQTEWAYLAVGFLLILASQGVVFLKWLWMRRAVGLSASGRKLFFAYAVSLVGGNFMPLRTGEVFSVAVLKEEKAKFLSMLFANRLFEGMATLSVLVFSFTVVFSDFLKIPVWLMISPILAGLGCLGLLIGSPWIREKAVLFFGNFPGWGLRVQAAIRHFFGSFEVLLRPRTFFFLMFMNAVLWGYIVMSNWFFFRALGSDPSALVLMAFISLAALSTLVAPTPGGMGLGDVPPAYFLKTQGYHDSIVSLILLGRISIYLSCGFWYVLALILRDRLASEPRQAESLTR